MTCKNMTREELNIDLKAAVAANCPDRARELLEQGADPNTKYESDMTLLYKSTLSGYI